MSVAVDHLLAGTVTGRTLSLAEHLRLHGQLPRPKQKDLIQGLAHAGLAGRGGAGFPTSRKLAAVSAHSGPKIAIANGSETEPMSEKDRVLIELAPHLVLDGLELAADAVGADSRIVTLGNSASQLQPILENAIRERNARNIRVVAMPHHYLAGQESALVNFIGGGPLKPKLVPPYPADQGLKRRPTLIQNAETLAHMALIARHGPGWFRAAGTDTSPGSVLVTVGGAIQEPGVYEVRGGSPLHDIIELAGGPRGNLHAVLVGGYFGSWLGPEAAGIHLDATRLARHGATLGTGVIAVLDDRHCPVAEVARVAGWMASQSAGQCGPCANGLPAMAGELDALVTNRGRGDSLRLLQHWGALVQRRGACHHPDGTARFVLSALKLFKDEFQHHVKHGRCERCDVAPALVVPSAEWIAA